MMRRRRRGCWVPESSSLVACSAAVLGDLLSRRRRVQQFHHHFEFLSSLPQKLKGSGVWRCWRCCARWFLIMASSAVPEAMRTSSTHSSCAHFNSFVSRAHHMAQAPATKHVGLRRFSICFSEKKQQHTQHCSSKCTLLLLLQSSVTLLHLSVRAESQSRIVRTPGPLAAAA